MDEKDNWKSNVLLTGAVIGTLAGLGAAYMFMQRAEREEARPEITPGEGVKLGLLVLGPAALCCAIGRVIFKNPNKETRQNVVFLCLSPLFLFRINQCVFVFDFD